MTSGKGKKARRLRRIADFFRLCLMELGGFYVHLGLVPSMLITILGSQESFLHHTQAPPYPRLCPVSSQMADKTIRQQREIFEAFSWLFFLRLEQHTGDLCLPIVSITQGKKGYLVKPPIFWSQHISVTVSNVVSLSHNSPRRSAGKRSEGNCAPPPNEGPSPCPAIILPVKASIASLSSASLEKI